MPTLPPGCGIPALRWLSVRAASGVRRAGDGAQASIGLPQGPPGAQPPQRSQPADPVQASCTRYIAPGVVLHVGGLDDDDSWHAVPDATVLGACLRRTWGLPPWRALRSPARRTHLHLQPPAEPVHRSLLPCTAPRVLRGFYVPGAAAGSLGVVRSGSGGLWGAGGAPSSTRRLSRHIVLTPAVALHSTWYHQMMRRSQDRSPAERAQELCERLGGSKAAPGQRGWRN